MKFRNLLHLLRKPFTPLVCAVVLYLFYDWAFRKTVYPDPVRLSGLYAFLLCVAICYPSAWIVGKVRANFHEAFREGPPLSCGERFGAAALFLITPWGNLGFIPLPAAFWLFTGLISGELPGSGSQLH